MTKIIGLTGGIGSGKTTIAKYFGELGIPVYIADDEARLITESPEILQSIQKVFGKDVFNDKRLNRAKLAQIVFENSEKLQQLNAIIHPAVKKHFKNWVLNHSNVPYVLKETALLFETGSYVDCDLIISIIAPVESRIERVMKRDAMSREEVLKRINSQWTDAKRIEKSNFIIDNTDQNQARIQVNEILKKITN